MEIEDLKGKYVVAEIPNNPFDGNGNFIAGLIPFSLLLEDFRRAKKCAEGFIEEHKEEQKTCAIIEFKKVVSNYSISKEIEEIERQIEILQRRKDNMLRDRK